MHCETFEEINIEKALINNYDLMADGQIVEDTKVIKKKEAGRCLYLYNG